MTQEAPRQAPRRSGGGTVVEASLRAVGLDTHVAHTALVETERPGKQPFSRVLAQNAWTVLPYNDYARLSAPYPTAWRTRMALRRAIAKVNLDRADEIVCLSDSMGELVSTMTSTPVTVTRALAPMDVASTIAPPRASKDDNPPVVLVPGTVTWYKRPQLAVKVAKDLGLGLRRNPVILFAGRDDGTGAWEAACDEAQRMGLEITRRAMDHAEMLQALRTAHATIVPSELESLSLSLSEALLLSPRVVASSLPVHRELSRAIGRSPEWLEFWTPHDMPAGEPAQLSPDEARDSWHTVGKALHLPERF